MPMGGFVTTATEQDLIINLTDAMPAGLRNAGFIKVPHSSDRSAYGFIPLPFAVLGPQEGPKILLLAGSHGDEAEAQIAATRLINSLDPGKMTGRLIALPMANEPAARAGVRNSPIDGLNLNRAYPGDPFGTPTAIIASYVEQHLMPLCDVVIDLHSTNASFAYQSCVTVIHHSDPDERLRRMRVALAFGAPMIALFHSYQERTSAGAAKRAGAIRIGTEIGGSEAVATMIAGLRRVLHWAGVAPAENADAGKPVRSDIRVVYPETHYIYASDDGLFEPAVALGARVKAGDVAGFVHDPSRPLASPPTVMFGAAGQVICARPLGPARRGDCLFHLAEDADDELMAEVAAAARLDWHAIARRRPSASRRAIRAGPSRARAAG